MSTYDRLRSLSNDRLLDVQGYFPVDDLREVMSDTIIRNSMYFTKGYKPRNFTSDIMSRERAEDNIQFLREIGVTAVRNVFVAFGKFDKRDNFRALPMYAGRDNKYERTFTGSYHIAIWNEWYNDHMSESDKDVFAPGPTPDEIGGHTLLVEGYKKPLALLEQPYDEIISPIHKGMLQKMSADIPMATYVLALSSRGNYMVFDEGNVEKVSY